MTKPPKPQDKSKAPPQDDLMAKVAKAAAGDSRVMELEKQVADLTEQLKRFQEAASRAQAELQNVKLRLTREAGEMRTFAAEGVLSKLLPTIDNFQRAVRHLPAEIANNEWVKGMVATEQVFLKQIGELGLKRFESLDQPVDPARHEVLMAGPGKAGTVIDVLEDGYELHGKMIRPAKVKVGQDVA